MTARKKKPSVGAEIDKLDQLREERKEKQAAADDAKRRENEQSEYVKEILKGQQLDKASGERASVSLSKSEVTRVTDWQKVEQFAKRNNSLHIFQRRLSEPSVRELVQNRRGKPLPGTEMVEIEKIHLNSR